MKLVMFIKKEFNHLMDAMDLTENGTKVFGDFVVVTTEKKGDVRKMFDADERIVAVYGDGEVAIRKGIKYLSRGDSFISTTYFEKYAKLLIDTQAIVEE